MSDCSSIGVIGTSVASVGRYNKLITLDNGQLTNIHNYIADYQCKI